MADNYKDMDGRPCSLIALCRDEPEWAESRILALRNRAERLEYINTALRARVAELEALTSGGRRCDECLEHAGGPARNNRVAKLEAAIEKHREGLGVHDEDDEELWAVLSRKDGG